MAFSCKILPCGLDAKESVKRPHGRVQTVLRENANYKMEPGYISAHRDWWPLWNPNALDCEREGLNHNEGFKGTNEHPFADHYYPHLFLIMDANGFCTLRMNHAGLSTLPWCYPDRSLAAKHYRMPPVHSFFFFSVSLSLLLHLPSSLAAFGRLMPVSRLHSAVLISGRITVQRKLSFDL